jgi:hypothetical protein
MSELSVRKLSLLHVDFKSLKVPQPRDWLAVWRSMKSPVSFRAASLFHGTAEFLRRTNGRTKDPSAEAMTSMVKVMAESQKDAARQLLMKATQLL